MTRLTQDQVETAAKIINGAYPEALKKLAGNVLNGEADPASLAMAKTIFDAQGPGAPVDDSETVMANERKFLAEINENRVRLGLEPLTLDETSRYPTLVSTDEDLAAAVIIDRQRRGLN